MKNCLLSVLLLLSCYIVGCSEKNQSSKPDIVFGPMKVYFESEIKLLESSGASLYKKLIRSDKTEDMFIPQPDWNKELVPFTETIASHSAKSGSYTADSTINGASKAFKYLARDSAAIIKNVMVYSTNNIPDSIVIVKHVSNSYYASSDTLIYYGKGNYLIKAENLPGIGKKIGFTLEGKTSLK